MKIQTTQEVVVLLALYFEWKCQPSKTGDVDQTYIIKFFSHTIKNPWIHKIVGDNMDELDNPIISHYQIDTYPVQWIWPARSPHLTTMDFLVWCFVINLILFYVKQL